MCQAVSMGKVSEELERRSSGALHYARWLTRVNPKVHFYLTRRIPQIS